MNVNRYGYEKTLRGVSVQEARARVIAALGAEGFGVLTEIDVQATFKKKLDLDFRPYLILGACHPTLANRAIGSEPQVGLLLPCNVVVQESTEAVQVSIVDPKAMLRIAENPELDPVAEEADQRLRRVIEALG